MLRGLDLDVPAGAFTLVTGPNGSGKTTLLRLVAGLLAPSRGELEVAVERGRVGFLAHEPLVYRELTAVENLDLFGRLYRVPERRERIGMLLERFGLWDVRADRVATYSRGMQQRLALCRALLHDPELLLLDEPYNALDAEGAELLDRELRALAAGRTFLVATHDPERLAPLAIGAGRLRMSGYVRDAAALARKDLLLELRGKELLPAMALFVRRDARRLPLRPDRRAGGRVAGAPVGRDRVHRAARPRAAPSSPSESRGSSTRSCSRRATAARSGSGRCSRRWRSSSSSRRSRCRRSGSSSAASRVATVAAVALANVGICAVGTLLAAMAVAGRAREVLLPLLFLPLAIPIVVGGVGATVADDPARYLGFLALYDAVFAILAWATFEYVVVE